MNQLNKLALAVVIACGGAGAIAAPTTIDFDPLPTIDFDGTNGFFVDGDFRVTAFWYTNTGTASWTTVGGHFHTGNGLGHGHNQENQHFNGSNQLQGFVITRTDGAAFSLTSLDQQVTGTQSVNGFSPTSVSVLLSSSFAPSGTVASQFTAFGVGGPSGTLSTLSPGGFNNVTSLFISSSASVAFDNIVLDAGAAVPEPGSFALAGLALVGLGLSRRRRA